MAIALTSAIIPRTPVGLFGALSLSTSWAPASPLNVPSLHICPPSPSISTSTCSKATSPGTPRINDLIRPVPPPAAGPKCRALTPNEARQLILLISQYLSPVRTSPKGLMRESINLSEKLHEAGIRVDEKRRVMGFHLREIWEQYQRLEKTGDTSIAFESHVRRSFLTIADEPHPLDLMPIPIEVDQTTIEAPPKTTLHAGLASISAPLFMDPVIQTNESAVAVGPSQGGAKPSAVIPGGVFSASRKVGWRDKKVAGLRVRTDAKYKDRPIIIPYSAASAKDFIWRRANLWGKSKPRKLKKERGVLRWSFSWGKR